MIYVCVMQIIHIVYKFQFQYGSIKVQPNFAFCNRKTYELLKKELKPLNNIFAFKGCFIIAGDDKEFKYFLREEKFRVGNSL